MHHFFFFFFFLGSTQKGLLGSYLDGDWKDSCRWSSQSGTKACAKVLIFMFTRCFPRLYFIFLIYYNSRSFSFYKLCYSKIIEKSLRLGDAWQIVDAYPCFYSALSLKFKMLPNLCFKERSLSLLISF